MRPCRKHKTTDDGQATVEFLAVVGLLMWFLLVPVYGWMVTAKYDQLRTIQQSYLSVLMINGELTTQDVNSMDQELQQYGFNPATVNYQGSTPFNTFISRGNPVYLNMGYPIATLVPQFWVWNAVSPSSVGDSWALGKQISQAP